MRDQLDLPAPEFIDLNGERIATYVLEPAHQPPAGDVVLCHGTPWSAAVWAVVARLLARDRRVFMYDMPGYGASISQHPLPVDLVTQRRRFASLLVKLHARSGGVAPDVVAHDIGGAVALGAHLFEGAQMSSLYLVDVVTLAPWGSPFFRLVAQHEEIFTALPSELHASLVRAYISGAASGGTLEPHEVTKLADPWCTNEGQRAFYHQIAQLKAEHTAPIEQNLGSVSCPTRIAWGESDPWIPVAQATELAARLPGDVGVFTVPGAGHLLPIEASRALAQDISDWLRSARAFGGHK